MNPKKPSKPPGYPWSFYVNGAYQTSGVLQPPVVRQGGSNPQYRRLIRSGFPAGSYYFLDKYHVVLTPASSFSSSNTIATVPNPSVPYHRFWTSGVYPGLVPEVSTEGVIFPHLRTDLSELDAKCLAKLYSKLREEQEQMNGLQFLGELREALHMIRSPAEGIRKALNTYYSLAKKRSKGMQVGHKKDAKAITAMLSETWLEISFGWKPLLQDTRELAKTIARHVTGRLPRKRVSYAVELEERGISSLSDFTYYQFNVLSGTTSWQQTSGIRWIVGLSPNVNGPGLQSARLSQLAGFDPRNFLPTLYELTPWSFLVDYFVNVGEIIGAATTVTNNVAYVCKNTRQVTTRSAEMHIDSGRTQVRLHDVYNVNGSGGGSLGASVVKRITFERRHFDTIPLPQLTLTLPGSVNQFANMASLVASRRTFKQLFS